MAPHLKDSLADIQERWTLLDIFKAHAALDAADRIKALMERER